MIALFDRPVDRPAISQPLAGQCPEFSNMGRIIVAVVGRQPRGGTEAGAQGGRQSARPT